MSQAPVITPMLDAPDPKGVVNRLFKVAEILLRKPSPSPDAQAVSENDLQKHDDQEIGYRETKDWLSDT